MSDNRAERIPHHSEHGNTPAAWTAVAIMILGSIVAAVAFWVAQPWLFFVGLGIGGLGLAVGKLMSMSGLGPMPTYTDQAPRETTAEGPTRSEGTTLPLEP